MLEVGCGPGCITRELSAVCSAVLAIDSSEQVLRQAREVAGAANVDYQQLNLYEVGELAAYGRFDAVVCIRILHHLPDIKGALILLARAPKPGGLVVFDLWNDRSFPILMRRLFGRTSGGQTYLRYPAMLEMIQAVGLSLVGSFARGYPHLGTLSIERFGP